MSKQSMRGPAWETIRKMVLDRDGWVCTWPHCNKPLEADDATVDHVVPIEVGLRQGWTRAELNAPTNLVAMCRKHNGAKRDLVIIRADFRNPRWLPTLA